MLLRVGLVILVLVLLALVAAVLVEGVMIYALDSEIERLVRAAAP